MHGLVSAVFQQPIEKGRATEDLLAEAPDGKRSMDLGIR
jgi:hypothetical protein